MQACSFALLEKCGRYDLNGIMPWPAAGVTCSIMSVVPAAAMIHLVTAVFV
jgi:hypothetical protein